MESPNRKYIPQADELRGAAAIMVFFYHSLHFGSSLALKDPAWLTSSNPLVALIYEGHTGVALFMVLSGYILATGTFDKDVQYWGFLKNRLLRIFPLMIVVLVFALYAANPADIGTALAPFLLLANTKAAFPSTSGLAGTVWTVSVEFQFYLIAPFLFLFVRRGRFARFLIPAIVLFWILRMMVLLPLALQPEEMHRITYYTIAGRINQFMIGIGLAFLIDSGRFAIHSNRKTGAKVLAAGVALALALAWILNQQGGDRVWHWWRLLHPEMEALIWAAFIAGYVACKPLGETTAARVLRAAGLISFSLYILHYAVLLEFWNYIYRYFLMGVLTSMTGVAALSAIVFIPVVMLALLCYHCIEKPFLDMRKQYVQPRPDA